MFSNLVLRAVVFASMVFFGTTSHATFTEFTGTSLSVNSVGCQMGGGCYFSLGSNPNNCLYDLIYFEVTTPAGKGAYGLILAAQMTGKLLSRVDYKKDSASRQCTLNLVSITN